MKKNNKLFGIAIVFLIIIMALLLINYINTPKEGNLISIKYKEIKEKINNKESFILVVSQSTCSHCASYKPKLELIAKDYGIDIYYIDYDKDSSKEEFLDDFDLDGSTPITLFINDGEEKSLLNRLEGDISKEKAIEKFKKMGFIEK